MRKFAILFAAVCLVALFSQESFAQCGGGGFYGGNVYRGGSFYGNNFNRGYRPGINVGYNNFNYGRPYYGRSYNYGYGGRPYYGGGSYYRGGYGRGISIRF